MKNTIARLTAVSAELDSIRNRETAAPRLIREYLGLVPETEIHALEAVHAEELEAQKATEEEAREDQEKAEKALDAYLEGDRIEIDKLQTQVFNLEQELAEKSATISELRKQLSERSDIPTPRTADDATIAAFTQSLCEERARVRQLESQLAAMSVAVVNPLDANPAAPRGKRKDKSGTPKAPTIVPMATGRPEITRNAEKDGIELRFNGKPDDATREAMKARGWRWYPGQPGQPWAHKYNEEDWIFAQSLATGSQFTPMPETQAPPPAAMPSPEAAAVTPPAPEPIAATAAPSTGRSRRIIMPEF